MVSVARWGPLLLLWWCCDVATSQTSSETERALALQSGDRNDNVEESEIYDPFIEPWQFGDSVVTQQEGDARPVTTERMYRSQDPIAARWNSLLPENCTGGSDRNLCPCSTPGGPRSCIDTSVSGSAGLGNRFNRLGLCVEYVDYPACLKTSDLGGDQLADFERRAAISLASTGENMQTRDHADCSNAIIRFACWSAFRRCDDDGNVQQVCASVCSNLKKACSTADECDNSRWFKQVTGPNGGCTGGALSTTKPHYGLLALCALFLLSVLRCFS